MKEEDFGVIMLGMILVELAIAFLSYSIALGIVAIMPTFTETATVPLTAVIYGVTNWALKTLVLTGWISEK